MEEVLKTGEEYQWKILSIEPKEHRMGLTLVKEAEKTPKKESKKKEKEERVEKVVKAEKENPEKK
jgi:ribosomal protein S1